MRVELRAAPRTGPLRESWWQKLVIQRNTMGRSQLSRIASTSLESLRNLSVRRTRGTLRAAARRALPVSLPIQETCRASAILSLVLIQTWTRMNNNQTYAHSEAKMKVSKNSQAKTQNIKIKNFIQNHSHQTRHTPVHMHGNDAIFGHESFDQI